MNKKPFRGVITPMVTPLSAEGNIDELGLNRLIEHLIGGGIHGLFVLGTTGEGTSLSYRFKHQLITLTCEQTNNRIPVFVGLTDSSPKESLMLAQIAKESGASYLVAAPPYYFGLTQQELKSYFKSLADQLPLPLFIYNIPRQTKLMIEPETVEELSLHPNIVGIKDSSGNAIYFNTLLHILKEKASFSILVGPDEMMASTVLLGGDGGVNSGSNLFPELFVTLYEAASSGDIEKVKELQPEVMDLSWKIYRVAKSETGFLKGIKEVLYLTGICDRQLSKPLSGLSIQEQKTIQESLETMRKNKKS